MHGFSWPSNKPLVQTLNVTKNYNGTIALNNLSLSVKPGEVLGLLGPNGAGKTTAIHILLGVLTPSSGEVSVLDLSPLKQRQEISKHINFSSAYVQLPTNLRVIENLNIFARLYCVPNRKQKVEELMELFEMTHLANRLAGVLSSGERTRLNLCKCFLNDPCLLLLDEPTASLDPEMADNVRKILKRLQSERKMGMVYTSHNMSEVEEMCDRILFIHQGETIAEGTHSELLSHFDSKSLDEVFIKIVRGA